MTCDADVLIVGAGPVGVGLAIELSLFNVSTIVVERNACLHRVPKGQNLTQRTGEHFRRWGVSREVRLACAISRDFGIAGVTTYGKLTGDYYFDWLRRADVSRYYAADNERLPQYRTEHVLRQRLMQFDCASLLEGWTATSLQNEDSGVTLTAEQAGRNPLILRGRYLVGTDGAGSFVRRAAGIGRQIEDHKRRMVLLVFHSRQLNRIVERFPGKSFFHIVCPGLDGYWKFLGRVDVNGSWFYHSPVDAATTETAFDAGRHLTEAIGCALDFTVEHVGFWDLRFSVANHYGQGRVFLAGDSAHNHPPYGGYGINMGFEDARNLGWKMAATILGWGGDRLLATYDEERRSIFVSTADEFIKRLINDDARLVANHDPVKDGEGFERAWNRFAIDSNLDVDQYCPHYSGSSIVVGGDKASGASGKHAFEARAGEHLYPARLSDDLTIVDILGDDIGVILTGLSEVEIDDCRRCCMQSSIPCSVHAVQQTAETSRWKAGVIVVRPDHFVAFAGKDVPKNLCAVIRKVVGS